MSSTPQLLFDYLRDIFYSTPNATLDLEKLDKDFLQLGQGLIFFAGCFAEYNDALMALAKGNLDFPMPSRENELAAPIKSLHANLKHLTWQSKQVAKGDYKQRVDFMGEFAEAFNTMIEQLAERQEKLEQEIRTSQRHATAMEQGYMLLSKLMYHIPQQIFVAAADGYDILLANDMATLELKLDSDYLKKLIKCFPDSWGETSGFEVQYGHGIGERYLSVSVHPIEWEKTDAFAFIINDVSSDRKQIKNLEDYAYFDELTHINNRLYGMLALNDWLEEKRQFSLIFVDLDNLKYVNDIYGHGFGDKFIVSAATHLKALSHDAVVCRLGGDEFMLLVPGMGYEETKARMRETQKALANEKHMYSHDYNYDISFGVVTVEEDNDLSASIILSEADERMYEHKRAKKVVRYEP